MKGSVLLGSVFKGGIGGCSTSAAFPSPPVNYFDSLIVTVLFLFISVVTFYCFDVVFTVFTLVIESFCCSFILL